MKLTVTKTNKFPWLYINQSKESRNLGPFARKLKIGWPSAVLQAFSRSWPASQLCWGAQLHLGSVDGWRHVLTSNSSHWIILDLKCGIPISNIKSCWGLVPSTFWMGLPKNSSIPADSLVLLLTFLVIKIYNPQRERNRWLSRHLLPGSRATFNAEFGSQERGVGVVVEISNWHTLEKMERDLQGKLYIYMYKIIPCMTCIKTFNTFAKFPYHWRRPVSLSILPVDSTSTSPRSVWPKSRWQSNLPTDSDGARWLERFASVQDINLALCLKWHVWSLFRTMQTRSIRDFSPGHWPWKTLEKDWERRFSAKLQRWREDIYNFCSMSERPATAGCTRPWVSVQNMNLAQAFPKLMRTVWTMFSSVVFEAQQVHQEQTEHVESRESRSNRNSCWSCPMQLLFLAFSYWFDCILLCVMQHPPTSIALFGLTFKSQTLQLLFCFSDVSKV